MAKRKGSSILSIQSMVSSGYVGNNVAGLAIALHGLDMVNVPTVFLSTHTDHAVYYGASTAPELFRDLLRGVAAIPVYERLACIVSGYINDASLMVAVVDFVQHWKEVGGNRPYVYDPVFGDMRTNGLYLPAAVADASIATLLPVCDIMTPNHFELSYLLGCKFSTINNLLEAVSAHSVLRDKAIVLTSALLEDTPADKVETVLIWKGKVRRFLEDMVPVEAVGTGDLFTAVLSAQLTLGQSLEEAIPLAKSFVGAVLRQVLAGGETEMGAYALLQALPVLQGSRGEVKKQ
ncbi:pyridoxal kinase [Sphingobacterium psychroaquaticum]|uniref:pyridoxal kinase n=1 Tax=Sphingobacterium psychroaquaticum TaxID=561061 RepID=A0A1X7KRJ1_9SPHI|nr:pyridoxal kinase [Sphingobacterium psychroaquaticum]SMG43864.1 pyridoxine kinase [Sphingobacterium psychroaquaticum]